MVRDKEVYRGIDAALESLRENPAESTAETDLLQTQTQTRPDAFGDCCCSQKDPKEKSNSQEERKGKAITGDGKKRRFAEIKDADGKERGRPDKSGGKRAKARDEPDHGRDRVVAIGPARAKARPRGRRDKDEKRNSTLEQFGIYVAKDRATKKSNST